jgi:hypothetical protein
MSRPAPRRSDRSLVEISRRLSDRDVRVLGTLAEVRLASARQIEALIFTEGSRLTRARRARQTMARLHELGLVARLDRRIGGVRAGSSGFIYRLAPPGRRLMGLPTSGWREPTPAFQDHSLAVVDCHVELAQAAQRGVAEDLVVQHEPHCWRIFAGPHGQRLVIKPDLYVQYAQGQYEHPWFVEIDQASEHRPTLATKCQQYLAYFLSGVEQQRHGVFPRVLWSVPTERRATELEALIAGLPDPAGELFAVSTHDSRLSSLGGDLTTPERR